MYNLEDLVVQSLQAQFRHLAEHPAELEFLFAGQVSNANQIIKAIRVIQGVEKERMVFSTAYSMQPNQSYSICVLSSGAESAGYLGDVNAQMQFVNGISTNTGFDLHLPRIIIVNAESSRLVVQPGVLWLGALLVSPRKTLHIVHNIETAGDAEVVTLDTEPPLFPGDWILSTSLAYRDVVVASSRDRVTATIQLSTVGEVGLHMALRMALRYALKRARRTMFEGANFINTSLTYSAVMPDDEDRSFKTTFNVTGEAADMWIESTGKLKSVGCPDLEVVAFDGKFEAPVWPKVS